MLIYIVTGKGASQPRVEREGLPGSTLSDLRNACCCLKTLLWQFLQQLSSADQEAGRLHTRVGTASARAAGLHAGTGECSGRVVLVRMPMSSRVSSGTPVIMVIDQLMRPTPSSPSHPLIRATCACQGTRQGHFPLFRFTSSLSSHSTDTPLPQSGGTQACASRCTAGHITPHSGIRVSPRRHHHASCAHGNGTGAPTIRKHQSQHRDAV